MLWKANYDDDGGDDDHNNDNSNSNNNNIIHFKYKYRSKDNTIKIFLEVLITFLWNIWNWKNITITYLF